MWRIGIAQLSLRLALNTAPQIQVSQRRSYKHYVMSPTLWNLEQACEQYCPFPRVPTQKVTVIGAGSDVGRIACLFLKQQNVIKTLAMYDEVPQRKVIGWAHDLAHIDTTTAIEAYQGRPYLPCALDNTDVVLICGGFYTGPPCCCILDRELFFYNKAFVRSMSQAVAHFAPHAVTCVQTPPVDCNFNLVKYTLKQFDAYDHRRVLGVNAINAMRANQLYCAMADADPTAHYTPVVCGTGRCTRVPVFSYMESFTDISIAKDQIDCITRLVRDADELICRVKSNNEQGHLSLGFATARFVTQIMTGLFDKPTLIDSALVEQAAPDRSYGLDTCASPVRVGKDGILEYLIPALNEKEKDLLEFSKCDLEDMLELGRCYAVGDEYCINPCKFYPCPEPEPCPVCEPCTPSD